jgi:hypothetical protein
VCFAVPSVAQRGLFNSGASGLTFTAFPDINGVFPVGSPNFFFPTAGAGDAVFSLFPFPNDPAGIYGENTFTQVLPADARGVIASAKMDYNFKYRERQQSFTVRYNYTDDKRTIPATGGAIFSALQPRVRTQNISTFLNSEVTGPNTTSPMFNQLRLSYGRTRLVFREVRTDNGLLAESQLLPDEPFLLNAPLLENFTLPDSTLFPFVVTPNTGPVIFRATGGTTEDVLGPIGQVNIAGFSPVGVDVFNFPQRRVNNTYQVADNLSWRLGTHSLTFGTDVRRTELNSDLPRLARPLLTFNGAPEVTFDTATQTVGFSNRFFSAVDLAAAGASSGFFQTLAFAGNSSAINLRYYQMDFFAQDEWRVRRNFSLSFGLRYEYNTPPREVGRNIERTFSSADLSLVPGLAEFVEGRSRIFDPDRNNFAPRVGFAYTPNLFGRDRATVIRAGYGLFYDQILGAVVSQSRNVFPNFLTVNFAGGGFSEQFGRLTILNPADPDFFLPGIGLVEGGTLNGVNPIFNNDLALLVQFLNIVATGSASPSTSIFGATLPARKLETPFAHHFGVTFEQTLGREMVFSAGYVGTRGRNLLRLTTPNLGPNFFTLPLATNAASFVPQLFGFAFTPGTSITPAGDIVGGRPTAGVGSVNIYESTASSDYDALQLQLRGRFARKIQYQVAYTFSKATDDVSDVFDLAGSPALPQNSVTFEGERGPANFDVRHRFSYNFVWDLPSPGADRGNVFKFLFGGIQLAGTGMFQTGQPFTVNSIFDVNLDGNLTDRLDTTQGIILTGDRRQPIRVANEADRLNGSLLAPVGQDGQIGRNTFRAGNVWLTNLTFVKKFSFGESDGLQFRVDIFNIFNRANFGVPVRFLEAPGFGQATETVTPGRRIQFALKYVF